MSNAYVDVIAPKALILPRTQSNPPIGMSGSIFISGGLIMYVSGASVWKVTATAGTI